MSTSISYKGQVIASFGNSTKTLNTAGTWLEDDITVTAVDSSAAITTIQELDSHGGTIKYINAIDLSNDTIDAAHLLQGYTAHDRDGNAITGTYTSGSTPATQSKTVTPTKSTQNVTPDSNYDYLSSVTVNPIPSQYIIPTGTKSITANGTGIDVTNYASVDVNVSGGGTTINNQNKTVTPTESQQSITADSGYTGLGTVTVNAIASTYVGSGVTQRDETDLTASGATVTVPAGYYAEQETKSVSNGSVTAPSSISGTAATVSTGTNTLTLTKTVSVTPNVTTAGYISSGTAGNSSVSLTANVTTKAAATITPGTSNQTISSGTYLTGTQTIAGDADLVAGNIKANTSIFNVTGTYTSDATAAAADIVSGETAYVNGSKVTGTLVIQHYYTGSSAPSSSLGVNGDIYLQN